MDLHCSFYDGADGLNLVESVLIEVVVSSIAFGSKVAEQRAGIVGIRVPAVLKAQDDKLVAGGIPAPGETRRSTRG
jgi:hypothetical protein